MSHCPRPLSHNAWSKTPPWPKQRSKSNDARWLIGHKATASQHHLDETGTLDVAGPYLGWPSQPKNE